jgi:hypothetical protein
MKGDRIGIAVVSSRTWCADRRSLDRRTRGVNAAPMARSAAAPVSFSVTRTAATPIARIATPSTLAAALMTGDPREPPRTAPVYAANRSRFRVKAEAHMEALWKRQTAAEGSSYLRTLVSRAV